MVLVAPVPGAGTAGWIVLRLRLMPLIGYGRRQRRAAYPGRHGAPHIS
jgi:hypothetical protein